MNSSRLFEFKLLVMAAVIGVSIAVFFFASEIIFGDIHEAGHALACVALGGNVDGFRTWLHGVLPFRNPPSTDCSIKPYPALVWAAGPMTSIAEWFTNALILTNLLNVPGQNPARASLLMGSAWHLLGLVVCLVPGGDFQ